MFDSSNVLTTVEANAVRAEYTITLRKMLSDFSITEDVQGVAKNGAAGTLTFVHPTVLSSPPL